MSDRKKEKRPAADGTATTPPPPPPPIIVATVNDEDEDANGRRLPPAPFALAFPLADAHDDDGLARLIRLDQLHQKLSGGRNALPVMLEYAGQLLILLKSINVRMSVKKTAAAAATAAGPPRPKAPTAFRIRRPLQFLRSGLQSDSPIFEVCYWLSTIADGLTDAIQFHLVEQFKTIHNKSTIVYEVVNTANELRSMSALKVSNCCKQLAVLGIAFQACVTADAWDEIHTAVNNQPKTIDFVKAMSPTMLVKRIDACTALCQAHHALALRGPLIKPVTDAMAASYIELLLSSRASLRTMIDDPQFTNAKAKPISWMAVLIGEDICNTAVIRLMADVFKKASAVDAEHWCYVKADRAWYKEEKKALNERMLKLDKKALPKNVFPDDWSLFMTHHEITESLSLQTMDVLREKFSMYESLPVIRFK